MHYIGAIPCLVALSPTFVAEFTPVGTIAVSRYMAKVKAPVASLDGHSRSDQEADKLNSEMAFVVDLFRFVFPQLYNSQLLHFPVCMRYPDLELLVKSWNSALPDFFNIFAGRELVQVTDLDGKLRLKHFNRRLIP